MTRRTDLQAMIRETRDRRAAERLSDQERVELRARIDARLKGRARTRRWTYGLGAVATIVVLFFLRFPPPSPAWYAVQGNQESCVSDDTANRSVTTRCGQTTIAVGADHLETSSGTTLTQEKTGIRLEQGRARIRVASRKPLIRPFVLHVSHGKIETHQRVYVDVVQHVDGGRLKLIAGAMTFHWAHSGVRQPLAAGDRVEWPPKKIEPTLSPKTPLETGPQLETETQRETETSPRKPKAKKPKKRRKKSVQASESAASVRALKERMFLARSQGQYDEARRLLQKLASSPKLSARDRMRFSRELGTLLVKRLGLKAKACAHWAKHKRRFPGDPHLDEVEAHLASCPRGTGLPPK